MSKDRQKDRHFIINCEVYPFDVFVYFGSSEGFVKSIKELSPIHSESIDGLVFFSGKSIMLSDGTSAIWVRDKPKTPSLKGILSHEIYHCVCFIMNRIGIKQCDESDEAYAYLIEYLTRKIYENLK